MSPPNWPLVPTDGMAAVMRDMPRYWELENQVLATLHLVAVEEIAIRQALLSAIMFGGLLNPMDWVGWLKSVTATGLLPNPVAIFFVSSGDRHMRRRWVADPLTAAILERFVVSRRVRSSKKKGKELFAAYPALAILMAMERDEFTAELQNWVLPGAQFKFTLQCPPILVAYATGSIRAHSLSPQWWGQKRTGAKTLTEAEKTEQFRMVVQSLLEKIPAQLARDVPLIDKRFHHLRAPAMAAEPEGSTDQLSKLRVQRKRMKEKYAETLEWRANQKKVDLSNSLGTKMTRWFYEFCPKAPSATGRTSRYAVGPGTMRKYAEFLGHKDYEEDWSRLWKQPVAQVYETTLVEILTNLINMEEEGDRGYAHSIANRLYGYLGGRELMRPPDVYFEKRQDNVRAHILTASQFSAMLKLLDGHPGSDAEKAACRLAAVLMFRTGLRGREAINLTVDNIDVMGDVVELRVFPSEYVKLKTPMSKRTLPLHVLLEPNELADLLRHRAHKARISRGQHQFVRMFFDEPLRNADYARLLEPIETALRLACDLARPKDAERKPSYIFSRCSSLRHSFVSYAMATMLLPRDPGAFALPAQIAPELVSLARRDQLEKALLAPGHLGLSAVQALRQLVGHASYRRTIMTYSHLLDVVLAAHCARRSVEPALPVMVTMALAEQLHKPGKFSVSALTRQAHDWTKGEQAVARAAEDSLIAGVPPELHVLPRQRRRDGAGVKPWEVAGNSFWSQALTPAKPEKPKPKPKPKLGEWRDASIGDWQTMDAILQLASRGVPVSIIADEVGVRADVCRQLMDRFHTIMTMKKSTRHGGPVGPGVKDGQLRQALVISGLVKVQGLFNRDLEDGSWDAPVNPIPFELNAEIDKVWARLATALKTGPSRGRLHTFLSGHDNGKRRLRSEVNANHLKSLFDQLFEPRNGGIAAAGVRQPATHSDAARENGKHVVYLARTNIAGPQWSAEALLIYLLMMALAASKADLEGLLSASSQRRKNLDRARFSIAVRNAPRSKPSIDPERLAHRRRHPVWD
jgi:integrase